MLSLKSLLIDAGLTTKEQADAAIDSKKKPPFKAKAKPKASPANKLPKVAHSVHQEKLRKLTKNEQYILIRKWVDLNRLDKTRLLDENYEKFFFHQEDESISWLSLDKSVIDQINAGQAGIITYMSNNGASSAVVPREIAEDIKAVLPNWVRVLN